MSTDLLGQELTAAEQAVLEAYQRLLDAVRRDDLPPCAAANLRHALSFVAVAAGDQGLVYEHLLDDGV